MKKALIYFLLFSGITLIFILLSLLVAGMLFDKITNATGISYSEVTLIATVIVAALWMVAIMGTFIHFRMADFGKGTLSKGGMVRTTILTLLILMSINIVGYGYSSFISDNRTGNQIMLLTFRSMPIATLILYIIIYTVTQLVFVGGILKELLASTKRHRMVILGWAVALSISEFAGGASSWPSFVTTIATYYIIGNVFANTKTIFPGTAALIITDFLLVVAAGYQPSAGITVLAAAILVISLPLLFEVRFRVASE
ncbi:hypothetical protein JCM15908A_12180 [Prevotella dentasini JCM 15908]